MFQSYEKFSWIEIVLEIRSRLYGLIIPININKIHYLFIQYNILD